VPRKVIIMFGKKFKIRLECQNRQSQNNVVQKTYKKRLRRPLPLAVCLRMMDVFLLLVAEILGGKEGARV